MSDIVDRLNDSLSAGYSELRKEAAAEITRLRKERDELRTELKEVRHEVAMTHYTINTLQAKIEAMEQQEPVAWCATDETETVVEALGMNKSRRFDTALYLAPGAQPASTRCSPRCT